MKTDIQFLALLLTPEVTRDYKYSSLHLPSFRLFYHGPLLGLHGIRGYFITIAPMRTYKIFIGVYQNHIYGYLCWYGILLTLGVNVREHKIFGSLRLYGYFGRLYFYDLL